MFSKKIWLSGFFLFALIFQFSFLVPAGEPLHAASLIPCGASVDDPATPVNESAPCTLCHLLFGIQNVLTWMRNVMTAIAIAVIVGMGILYIVSAGNDSLMSYAKSGIKASLIGFSLILGAWLIVNVIFNLPVFNNASGLIRQNWFTFSCNLASNATTGSLAYNPGVTPITPPSVIPPNPIVNPIDLTGSSGVTFSLPTSEVYPGNIDMLTLGGSLNFNLGPVTFSFDTATFSIPDANTLSVPITVLSNARPGDYVIKAYQGGLLLGQFTLTVLAIPFNPGTDLGGPGDPGNPGGGDDGGGGGGSGGGGGGGGTNTGSATLVRPPAKCLGRTSVVFREWTPDAEGDPAYNRFQASNDLWFTLHQRTVHVVAFKTSNQIYAGQVSAGGGIGQPGLTFLSTSPCDVSTIVSRTVRFGNPPVANQVIAAGNDGTPFRFIAASAAEYTAMRSDNKSAFPACACSISQLANQSYRLDPGRYYYIHYVDDGEAASSITPGNPPTVRSNPRKNGCGPDQNGVGCGTTRFDAWMHWSYYYDQLQSWDGSLTYPGAQSSGVIPGSNHTIPGYTR